MTDIFRDQARFMQASGQTTGHENLQQLGMYLRLMEEEANELADAIAAKDRVAQLDALIDIIVVTVGAIHSMGADGEGAWNEVMKSNLAKVDTVTGRVTRREDGKILKPEGWQPPQLGRYLHD